MPLAELILESSPSNFESFYLKATDQTTSLVVLVAAREQVKRLRENLGEAPGLYVLQAEDSTVYVGQSKNLRDRLKSHRSSDKIKFRRVMAMYRDQGLARYLDYAEARIYQDLKEMGYRLDQNSLTSSLSVKKERLLSLDKEHVSTADGLIRQFLSYVVALGLARPTTQSHTKVPVLAPEVAVPACPRPAVAAYACPTLEAGRAPGGLAFAENDLTPMDGPKALVF